VGEGGLAVGHLSQALKELLDRESYIFCYLSEKYRGYIPSTVKGYRRDASIRMSELLVGTPLSDLLESKSFEHADDFSWLEDRSLHHG
jgi:hypothetical protein